MQVKCHLYTARLPRRCDLAYGGHTVVLTVTGKITSATQFYLPPTGYLTVRAIIKNAARKNNQSDPKPGNQL